MSQQASITQHLQDLRQVLIKIFLSWVGAFVICWFFKNQLLYFIELPISPFLNNTEGRLIVISPLERFFSYLKLSFFAGLFLASPYWLYQVYQFLSPGLYQNEKRQTLIWVFLSVVLFFSGALFVYFVLYPLSFHFLLGYSGGEQPAYISLKEYISFFIRTSLSFSFLFQFPLILMFVLKLGLIHHETLSKSRSYVLVVLALLSSFFTPPDLISMFFMFIPLYLFFELSLFFAKRWDF